MAETEVTTEDQRIHANILEVEAEVVLWFVTMVESDWGRYMWDNKIRNLYIAYVQVWAHGLHRYTVLAVVVG